MHRKSVNDIQITKDKSMCITASKDFLAKVRALSLRARASITLALILCKRRCVHPSVYV